MSRLIDSAISMRQGEQRKQSFLEKKNYSIKGKVDSLWTPRNVTSLDGLCYEAIDSSVPKNIFSYLKMFSMQCRKSITVEDNRKRMSIANFINIYIYKYVYLYYMWREWRKIKMIQYTKYCSMVVVVFPTSGFPYLILCTRQCKWKVATTKLPIWTKNN